jgi:NAD(P)-dependent dehydrogenase (short-subunit alcohol dehydrogenase family)
VKVAVVTGATRGLGKEVARQLAEAGCTVVVGARDLQHGEHVVAELTAGLAGEGSLWPVALDVEHDASVDDAVAIVGNRAGRVDILVNNAGIMIDDQPPHAVDAAVMQRTLAVNVVGVVRVIHAFLPLLRQAEHPRVVNVSSEAGSLTRASTPGDRVAATNRLAYMASKAALNSITVVYANALADVDVVSVSPGFVATELNGYRGELTVEKGASILAAAALGSMPSGSYVGHDGPIPW